MTLGFPYVFWAPKSRAERKLERERKMKAFEINTTRKMLRLEDKLNALSNKIKTTNNALMDKWFGKK